MKRDRSLKADEFQGEMRQVFLWHELMRDFDEAVNRLEIGLCNTFQLIREGDYSAARASLDDAVSFWTEIRGGS